MISINENKERQIKRLLLLNLVSLGVILVAGLVFLLFFYNDTILFKIMFSDFTQIMQIALSPNPYQGEILSSYPPLAILILYFPFALICRNVLPADYIQPEYTQILKTPQFWTSFILFYLIFLTAAAFLLKKLTGFKGKNFAVFFLMIVLSGMVLYTLERGNVIVSAFVFVLFFLAFYKSENKVFRELALISLALAGAIKIYPLLFGILLLRDKKFFASARVAVYTFTLFFLPFLFFEGGFSNIRLFIENLGGFSLNNRRLLKVNNMSSTGLVYKLFYVIGLIFNTSMTTVSGIASTIITVVIAATAITGALLAKNKLSVYIICTAAMILLPPVSYYYSAIFLIIPLVEFLNEYETLTAQRKKAYLIFFMIQICVICSVFCSVLGLLLVVALFYESVKNIKDYRKKRQNKISQGDLT